MRESIGIALKEWLPKVNTNAPRKMMDRSYYFYEQWGTSSKRIPTDHTLAVLEPTKKKHIHSFLATGLYSIIQECSKLDAKQKALFDCPTVTWTAMTKDGTIKDVTDKLLDDRNLPFSFDFSFKSTSKKKQASVTVVEDDDEQSDE
jgi:hypothetical protein